jgi:hypothetical protein
MKLNLSHFEVRDNKLFVTHPDKKYVATEIHVVKVLCDCSRQSFAFVVEVHPAGAAPYVARMDCRDLFSNDLRRLAQFCAWNLIDCALPFCLRTFLQLSIPLGEAEVREDLGFLESDEASNAYFARSWEKRKRAALEAA